MKALLFTLAFLLCAVSASAQNFTIEINRAQPDAASATAAKTSPAGLAFTYSFQQANLQRVAAGFPPYANEPAYLKALVEELFVSWRLQQQDVGVAQAYAIASDATKAQIRTLLGLP